MNKFISPPTFFLFAFFSVSLQSCTLISLNLGTGEPELIEKVVSGEGEDKILMVDISGIITGTEKSETFGLRRKAGMVERIKKELKKAAKDEKVKALLLRINSPGGTVTASDIIYHEITKFKEEKKIPIVAVMMGMATSGAYYIAVSADKIIAHPTTVTGSIGVIVLKLNFKGLMEKVGIEDETVKSGDIKDMVSPFRPMTKKERKILQSIIDSFHQRFVNTILSNRKIAQEELNKIADGRVFTADDALKYGLIDEIGFMDEAVKTTRDSAGLKKAKVIIYQTKGGRSRDNIYSLSRRPSSINLLNIDLGLQNLIQSEKFLYLWAQ